MSNKINDKISLKHGWYHYWDEPVQNKIFLKEYVKGPFIKTVLMFSDPYLIDAKQDSRGESSEIKTGIPDPWSEYVICNYLLTSDNSPQQCKMFKEDMSIADTLRKRYRLYLGQGIPDPCLIHPYINRPDFSKVDYMLNKARSLCSFNNYILKKSRKKHCFCCEKKYLFECPDEAKETSEEFKCFCLNCHGQVIEDLNKSDVKEICTRVHYYDNASSPEELKCASEAHQLERTQHFQDPIPLMINSDKRPTPIKKPNIQVDASKKTEKEVDRKPHVTVAHDKPLRPQSSEKKFRICCCPYFKKTNSNQGKVARPKPTKVPLSKAPPQITKTTAKEIQTEPAKCSKEVQTNQKSYSLSKYPRVCECTSKCVLCDSIQCRVSNTICPNTHSNCFGQSCCLISLVDSLEKDQHEKENNALNQKGQEFNKKSSRLKPNQKMYCCTFTPECSGCSFEPINESARDERQKNKKKSSKTNTNNSFVYRCGTPSMAAIMKNYLECSQPKNFNSKKTSKLPNTNIPSLYYELKPGGKKLTGFDFPLGDLEGKNYQDVHSENRSLHQIGTTFGNSFAYNATAHIPLEVKYLNVKSEESKTYGLLNSKNRRRGRKIRSATHRKFSTQKFNISERRSQNETKRRNKIAEIESREISSQLRKFNSKNRKVSFSSSK